MKKNKSFGSLILVFAVALVLCACSGNLSTTEGVNTATTEENTEAGYFDYSPMLRKVYKGTVFDTFYILADDENVMYLVYDFGKGGAGCMMVNPDGSPRLWTESDENISLIEVVEEQGTYTLFRDVSTNVLYIYTKQMSVMKNANGEVKLYVP